MSRKQKKIKHEKFSFVETNPKTIRDIFKLLFYLAQSNDEDGAVKANISSLIHVKWEGKERDYVYRFSNANKGVCNVNFFFSIVH